MATELIGNTVRVNSVEKKVLLTATLFIGASLALIAYATWGLGITVPDCIPASKGFEQASIIKHEGKNYEIHYVSRMWAFEPSVIRVPTGSTLDLYVISRDVTHGLQIAATNVNLMVVPGAIANSRVHFDHPGVYTVVCHEYCGAAHHNMNARIEVSDKLTDIAAEGLPESGGPGKQILDAKGCLACHSLDGTPGVGPTLKGIWGTSVQLTDGTGHTMDPSFLREMLLHPSKNVVRGYEPLMPEIPLTEEEIKQIERYLKDLK